MLFVEAAHQIELATLCLGSLRGIAQIRNHPLRIEIGVIDVCPLMLRRQKGARPHFAETHRPTRTQDDEARQLGILAAEAVREPRAAARPSRRHAAVVHHEQGRAVVRIVGVYRAQDADIVDATSQARQQLADFETTLAATAIAEWHRHQPERLPFGAQIDLRRPLPGIAIQIGLGIEHIGAERAAVHEQMDDPFGLWPKVRRGGCRRRQQIGERQTADAATEGVDHVAA